MCLQYEPAISQILKGGGKKVWISLAQWAHLTVLSAQCCYIDFLIYKQYGSTSRREHVFRLTLEVALKQSVSSFDLDCLSESLSKTRLTWHCRKWQILYSQILSFFFFFFKKATFFKNVSDMLSFNSFLWFGSNKNFSPTLPLRLGGAIQQNSPTLTLSSCSLGQEERYERPP